MKKLDRFEIVILGSKSMKSATDIGRELLKLGTLMMNNKTFIQNCEEKGGNGMIVDLDNENVGKWVYVVEKKK